MQLVMTDAVDKKTLPPLLADGFQLLTYNFTRNFTSLSAMRKSFIRPNFKDQYQSLCNAELSVTFYLFGDDLGKKMRDIYEANNVGSAFPQPRDTR